MQRTRKAQGCVLVTGASGFLGSHIAQALAQAGYTVRGMKRHGSRAPALDPSIEWVEADLGQAESLAAAVEGTRAIVHAAASVPGAPGSHDARVVERTNVAGLEALLTAATQHAVDRFVLVSSVGVYGMRHHHGTREDFPIARTGDPYTDSKVAGELAARRWSEREGRQLVILRPGITYGVRDRYFLPRLVRALASGTYCYVDHGRNVQALVHAPDVAAVVPAALESDAAAGHAFTLVETEPCTTRELIETLAPLIGVEPPTRSFPAWLGYAWCYALETLHRIVPPRTPPVTDRAGLRFSALSRRFDASKAVAMLGFAPNHDRRANLAAVLAAEPAPSA